MTTISNEHPSTRFPIQFVTVGDLPQVPAPLVRISACGLLSISHLAEVVSTDPPVGRYITLSADQLRGRGIVPALTLLKLLIGEPHRYANKDWLMEQAGRADQAVGDIRLDNIASQLRSLLTPSLDESMQEGVRRALVRYVGGSKASGSGYMLAEYPLIWVDIDALARYVKQAVIFERMADDALPFWERTAEVTSQSYLLAASLAGHRNDLQARQYLSEQALLYGKLAQDRNLQIAAWRQLSITFDYLEQPNNVLQIYQQVLPYLGDISPLLRACIYAGVSGAYAQQNRKQEAFHFMSLAYKHFPTHPEREPSFLHVMCRYSTLVFFDGLNYLGFNQPNEAERVFAQIDGLQPKIPIPERVRIELLNYQVEVFTALRSLGQACTYLEAAAQAAQAIGSERRLKEAFELFEQMQRTWPYESQVQRLRSLFP